MISHEHPKEGVQFIAKGLLTAVEQKDHFIPEGAEVRIIQNPEDTHYLILPASPKTLTQAELKMVAGGDTVKTSSNVVAAENLLVAADYVVVAAEAHAAASTDTVAIEADLVMGAVAALVVCLI